jgi:outer membrane biosynthesis protein TonB
VPAWDLPRRSAPYIVIRINRNMLIAAIVSLLFHIVALILFLQRTIDLPPAENQPQPITVVLNPRMPVQTEAKPPPAAIAQPVPEAPSAKVPKRRSEPPPESRQIRVPEAKQPVLTNPPAPSTPSLPAPAPKPAPPMDMLAYVNANRERRQQAEAEAARINAEAAARERGPTEDEVRMANLQRNMQPPGTNGIFQIISKDARSAQFSFRGWKNDFSYSRREVYQVEAGLNGNIDRAIVRKMIEIIRKYYSGDFNWESPRLGRVVVLSARPEDNDGLEDFMMQEFFITGGIPAR